MKQLDMFARIRTKQGRLLQPQSTTVVIDATRNPDYQKLWARFQSSPSWAYIILSDNDDGTGFGYSVGVRVSTVTRKNKNGTVKHYEYRKLWAMVHRNGLPTISLYIGKVGHCADVDLIAIGYRLSAEL